MTRRVRRMNCSRSCFRRLFGMLSLGITNLSLRGTLSPISCISPSTSHHSDFSSTFLIVRADNFGLLRVCPGEPESVLANRSWRITERRQGLGFGSRLERWSMVRVEGTAGSLSKLLLKNRTTNRESD